MIVNDILIANFPNIASVTDTQVMSTPPVKAKTKKIVYDLLSYLLLITLFMFKLFTQKYIIGMKKVAVSNLFLWE